RRLERRQGALRRRRRLRLRAQAPAVHPARRGRPAQRAAPGGEAVKRVAWLSIVAAAAANASDPYYYMDFKNFSDAAHPLQYYVDNRVGQPAGVTVNSVKNAADDAWNQWNAVSCAIPKSQSMGFTSGVVPDPANPYDVFNVNPVFITDQSGPYFADI